MNIPGFTAEASLCQTSGVYHQQTATAGQGRADSKGIVPSFPAIPSCYRVWARICRIYGGYIYCYWGQKLICPGD